MLFNRPSKDELPEKPELADVQHGALKAIVSIVPGASEALSFVLSSPLEDRRNTWFKDLAERLRELEEHVNGFKFDELSENQQFVSATVQATQIALRTHQQEKLEALRNAVLNTALGRTPKEDYQTVYLAFVDRFTPAHLRLLKSFDQPTLVPGSPEYLRWNMEKLQEERRWSVNVLRWIRDYTPGFSTTDPAFTRILIGDLYSSGLTEVDPGALGELQNSSSWTTPLGKQFLAFITSPLEAPLQGQ